MVLCSGISVSSLGAPDISLSRQKRRDKLSMFQSASSFCFHCGIERVSKKLALCLLGCPQGKNIRHFWFVVLVFRSTIDYSDCRFTHPG